MIAEGVMEYSEELNVEIEEIEFDGFGKRWVVIGKNEGGCNCTQIDLKQLIEWVKANKPEILG